MKGLLVGSCGKKDKDGMGVGCRTVGKGDAAWLFAIATGTGVPLGVGEGWCMGVGGGRSLGVGEAGW